MMGAFLLGMLSSCFQTREIEPPQSGSSDWVSPTDYTILLDNFKLAVATGNTQNYMRCFRQDSLEFNPSSAVLAGNELIWSSWDAQDEQAWFDNAWNKIGVKSGNYLELEEVDLQTFSTDSVRYIADYELKFQHSDTSLTQTLNGQLEFLCKVNELNEWEIHRWSDFETAIDSSWSELKLIYVQ